MRLQRTRRAPIEVFDPDRPDEMPIYEGRPCDAHERLMPGEYYAKYTADLTGITGKPTVLIVHPDESYTVDLSDRDYAQAYPEPIKDNTQS